MQSYEFKSLFTHSLHSEKIAHRKINNSLPKSLYQFLDAGYEYNENNYYHERVNGTTYLIAYTISGQAILNYDGLELTLLPGSLTFIHLKEKSLIKTTHADWEIYFIHVLGSDIDDIYRCVTQNKNYVINNFNPVFFQKTIEELYVLSTTDYDPFYISEKIYSLLMDVFKQSQKFSSSMLINQIVSFINNNYSNNISIDDICNAFYISKYYFIRRFRCEMKITPKQYLTQIRLNKAQLLLAHTNKKLNEIALLCGFKTERNLIYSFNKHLNTSPDNFIRDKYNKK